MAVLMLLGAVTAFVTITLLQRQDGNSCSKRLTNSRSAIASLSFSPNGDRAAVSWYDSGGFLRESGYRTSVYDVRTGVELAVMNRHVSQISWVDDVRLLYLDEGQDLDDARRDVVWEWNYTTGQQRESIACRSCAAFAVSSSGRVALGIVNGPFRSVATTKTLEIRDGWASSPSLSLALPVRSVRWSPDGTKLAVELDADTNLVVVDGTTSKMIYSGGPFSPPTQGKPLWFSNDELLVGDRDGPNLYRLDVVSGALKLWPTANYVGPGRPNIMNIDMTPDKRSYLLQIKGGDIVLADAQCNAPK